MSQQPTDEPVPKFYKIHLAVTAQLSEADVRRAYELELPWRLIWEAPVEIMPDKSGKTLLVRCLQEAAYSGIAVAVKRQPGQLAERVYAPVDSSLVSDETLVTEPRSDNTTKSESSSDRTADTIPLNNSDSMDVSIQTQIDPGDQESQSLLGKQ